ncbi:MAG TPA: response regulator transcription factor [Terriglobales bacterium]
MEIRTIDTKPRVLIAEDNEEMVQAIVRKLGDRFDVIGIHQHGEEALRAVLEHQPHVVLLDILLPGLDGIMIARRLRSAKNTSKIVMLTGMEDRDYVRAAMEAGAHAYVFKRKMNTDLNRAIESALTGETFISCNGGA